MLSLPDPAHERAEWLILPELVKLIRKAEGCSGRRAQKQIRTLLGFGELAPLRWENPPLIPTPVGTPGPLTEGRPPTGHKHWADVQIKWRAGEVLDDFDLTQEGLAAGAAAWRRLFVYRPAWEGRALARARAEREFHSPDWSLGNVLSWIAFRDPALIRRFEDRHNLLARRLVYDHPRSPPRRRMRVASADCDFEPHWIGFIAPFGSGDRDGDMVWFDRRKAAENRIAAVGGEPVARGALPPLHARDIMIDRARLDELYPPAAEPEDWFEDPPRYEEQMYRLARADREQRGAYDGAWNAVWNAERAKPLGQRRYFSFAELAEELSRDPRTLAVDAALRGRMIADLTEWVKRQQFDLAGGEVATLSGDPPDFVPLAPLRAGEILADPEMLMLRRDACRRYVGAQAELPSAAGLLRQWFEDTEIFGLEHSGLVPATVRRHEANEIDHRSPQSLGRRGRKKGSGSIDDAERLRAMLRLLASGRTNTVHAVARKVAESMVGSSQSRSADIARLRRKFAKAYGTEPPTGKTWADVEAKLNAN